MKVKAYRNRKEKHTIEKERYTLLLRKFKGVEILFYMSQEISYMVLVI